jgi:hypothetical protein
MQLFVIGLIVTTVIVRNGKAGSLLCLFLIVMGNVSVIYLTMTNISSPVLIDAEATRNKTQNYLDYVHFSTFSHLSNYFIGVMAAYIITIDGLLLKNAKIVSIVYNVAVAISCTIHFAPALHNTFGLLPQTLVPYYIVTIKFLYVFYFSMFLFTNIHRWTKKKDHVEVKPLKDVDPFMKLLLKVRELGNRWAFGGIDYLNSAPLFRLIINLSTAIYISNYAYIRSDFFSSRNGMSLSTNTVYSILNRLIYSIWFVLAFGLLFHLLFMAPFDSLRRRFRKKSDSSRSRDASKQADKNKTI